MEILLGLAFLVAAAIGAIAAGATTRSADPVNANSGESDCGKACDQVQERRSDVCKAVAATQAARARVDAAAAIFAAASVAAGLALLASAGLWIMAAVPLFGFAWMPFAAAATTVFVILSLAATAALTALVATEISAAILAAAEAGARRNEQDAITIMRGVCDAQAADACLNRPRPC